MDPEEQTVVEQVPEVGQAEVGKKRKRTGKQREEAKKAAIQAKIDAEAAAATGATGKTGEDVTPGEGGDHKVESKDDVAEAKTGPDTEKIAGRIPQALKTLNPTFKQAKTFEVRRLVKKVKFLRGKDNAKDEVADLEAQLSLLSHTPLGPIAQSHLLLKLAKHPLLKQSPLPSTITSLLTPADAPTTSASQQVRAKVENRLCSSKLVAEAVKTVLSWLVGEEGAKLGRSIKGKPEAGQIKAKKQTISVESEDGDDGDTEDIDDDLVVPSRRAGEQDSDDDLVQEDMAADEAGWESGSLVGDDRLGPNSSDEDLDDESDSGSDTAVALPSKKAKPTPSAKPAKPTKTAKAAPEKPVTASTFLPSLSTGFTLGDSDSDPDLDPDVDGAGIVGRKGPERKNRRGQRARQAIWEKKYGKGAKHVVKAKEEEEKKTREKKWGKSDEGWGGGVGRGGAVGARGGRGGAMGGRGGFAGGDAGATNTTAVSPAAAPARPAAAKPSGPALHPSWEAARLRRQKQMEAAPQATKITFD